MNRILTSKTVDLVDQEVKIAGWIHARRDMGKVIFFDVRDKDGLIQVVVVPGDVGDDNMKLAESIRSEWVVEIEGVVQKRGEKQVNKNLKTGTVELLAKNITVLNESKTPPFEIDKDTSDIKEETRLKYRYLDLRSERLAKNIRLRSQYIQNIRQFLFDEEFVEIETPYLTKATPEGSRDFIVPSRLQHGKFFALPQSPQQYKQLLMTAGFERYFQIARCFRDEDLRADRGFEHTQLDFEMSFVERQDVMDMIERMMIAVTESMGFTLKKKPFPVFPYKDAMTLHGDDKFDLRTDEEKEAGVLAFAWVVDFPFFEKADDGGWTFTHNPFSNPLPKYKEDLLAGNNIENILTSQYDLVCNGYEVGGGSIRAHEAEVLQATYKVMGYSDQEIEASVGHMLEAFEYGAPPHGGIGMGIDRMIMIMASEIAMREVVAFPMTASGQTAVMDAPSELPKRVLREVHVQVDEE